MSPYYINIPNFRQPLDLTEIGPGGAMAGGPPPAAQPLIQNQVPGEGLSLTDKLYGLTSLASLYGDFATKASQRLNLDNSVPQIGEIPSYSGSGYNQAVNAKPQGAGAGEVLGATAKGAAAGAAFGVPGAVIGGLVGGIGELISGGLGESAQERQKREAVIAQHNYQGQFNQASNAYQRRQDADVEYQRRLNNYNRYANLYRTPSQYVA